MLRHVDPSAQHVRDLARRLVRETCEAERSRYAGAAVTGRPPPGGGLTSSALEPAWRDLLAGYGAHREAVAGQISAVAEASIASGDRSLFVICIRLASTLSYVLPSAEASCHPDVRFWDSFAKHVIHEHHAEAAAAARTDAFVRRVALDAGVITAGQALTMPGGPVVLFQYSEGCLANLDAYYGRAFDALMEGWPAFGGARIVPDLVAFGEYTMAHREPPWLHGRVSSRYYFDDLFTTPAPRPAPLSQAGYLGAAGCLLIMEEAGQLTKDPERRLGPLRPMAPYLTRRQGTGRRRELPGLRVPGDLAQTFLDWADGRVSITAPE